MSYLSCSQIIYTSYTIGNVVGSVVVACAAVIVALYIMFIVLRPKLKHGWFIKVAIACILGAAVCCMHYIAMGGESASSDHSRATRLTEILRPQVPPTR
jgi:NO-binding membrane sensor protein with MHYT domain